MSAYLIADVRVVNRQKFDLARAPIRAFLESHGGVYLAHGQEPEVVQGGWHPQRMMLVEFPSRESVDGMFATREFGEMRDTLVNMAMFDIVVVDGITASRYAGEHPAPVYAVSDMRIVNRAVFDDYRVQIHRAMREHQGRYLVLTDEPTTVAGNWTPPHLTIMEFPSRGVAIAAYTASRYQEARERGNNAAMIDMVLLAGGPVVAAA
ncbi:MAG: DUF1330 domain-containing protein [Burkholderiales bacterium]